MKRIITVTVDPRVELMSIIFRLANNPEYCQGRVPSYFQDAGRHFGRFRDHPVVTLATKLRQTCGVSHDAVMTMAVLVTDAFSLQGKTPFAPQPKSRDRRWTPETAREFLELARRFVVEADFKGFLDQHEPLYQFAVQRMRETLDQQAHLDWFDRFFGPRNGADFHVVLNMLSGGGCYGPRAAGPDGREELHCIVGVWRVDAQGQPKFSSDVVPIIVHEFTHSYTNPLVDQFAHQLQSPGEQRERGPKIVSLVPANGAQNVDPKLQAIVVTFDRPMRDKGWAVVTLVPDQFPKITGPVGYDAARQVFTVPAELQPGKEYVFGLNAERFLGFYNEEGTPLVPVVVRFKTRQADK